MNNIGQRIKELRKKNDLTQEQLADYIGVTDKAVSKWECGLTMPDISLIIPLARIFHVSADELLSGKQEEIDERRAEFDMYCDNYLKYDTKEIYQIAQTAVNEYPMDYKYLSWLALCEMNAAYCNEYKEDTSAQYSKEMMEKAIKHNNIVIADCIDTKIREKAIWNAMVCCGNMNNYDEALKYAEMFPRETPLTRDKALDQCLRGEPLIEHRKWRVYQKLYDLCIAFSRIYWFAETKEPYVIAALDTEELILKTVFTDGNYFDFHRHLCCAYQKRADFEIIDGNYDKAVEYLQIMMDHAKRVPREAQLCNDGVFDGVSMRFSQDNMLTYMINGLDDINKTIFEQLKNRLRLEKYAPLREREDFLALLE